MRPSRRSLRGLDWFCFFIADVQTGFGPFIAVYLTTQAWTQVDIGLVLTAGSLVALAAQVPAGALIDWVQSKRSVAAFAIAFIAASALIIAVWPIFPLVLLARVLHGLASSAVSPAIAAISLGLVGHAAIGARLGRNARFASIGTGIAAAVMGTIGDLVSTRAVFFFTATLTIPTLLSLGRIRPEEVDPVRARGGLGDGGRAEAPARLGDLLRNRPLLIFGGCLLLFHLANAAMLPLMAGIVTMRSSDGASVLIAACIVVPQLIVALFSPWVGRRADLWGRRPLLLLGFAALALRGLLFAVVADPYLLVAVQVLEGVSAAVLGVMMPLVVADLTRGSGRFNVALGMVGTAVGLGASFSTAVGGYMADVLGAEVAFLGLAAIAAAGLALLWAALPETRAKALAG